MMLHTIGNQFLSVSVNEMGAELWSILGCDGTQYLWQGDPRYWKDRALTIFPYVARLTQGRYVMDGQEYEMPIHGFAPHSRFHLIHILQIHRNANQRRNIHHTCKNCSMRIC